MQYFTFLGLGGYGKKDNGYTLTSYVFEDEDVVCSSIFVQQPIIEKFRSEIKEVYVLCTERSYKENKDLFEECLQRYKKKNRLYQI